MFFVIYNEQNPTKDSLPLLILPLLPLRRTWTVFQYAVSEG